MGAVHAKGTDLPIMHAKRLDLPIRHDLSFADTGRELFDETRRGKVRLSASTTT